jgi:hypothetical protein
MKEILPRHEHSVMNMPIYVLLCKMVLRRSVCQQLQHNQSRIFCPEHLWRYVTFWVTNITEQKSCALDEIAGKFEEYHFGGRNAR